MARQESQNQERPLECLDFRKDKEAAPLLKARALRKAAAMYKSTTEVYVDGFHPKVPMDYPDEYFLKHFDLLYKVNVAHLANLCEYLPLHSHSEECCM